MPEETKNEAVEKNQEQVDTQTQEPTAKTYTQQELDQIIRHNVSRAVKKTEKQLQEKIDEAEKMRQMSNEKKLKYEQEKKDNRIKELEAELSRNNLESEARKQLAEKGLFGDDVLQFVVKDNAESTLEAIKAFYSAGERLADEKVSERLKGRTPSSVGATSGNITKTDFEKMTVSERMDLYAKNPELYKQLK